MWNEFWSLTTLLIALVGVYSFLFSVLKSKGCYWSTALNFSLILFFAVTVFFGASGAVDLDIDHILYPVRVIIMVAVIYCGVRVRNKCGNS